MENRGLAVDFLWQDITHAPFWIGVFQIIFVNVILSGDNAVVIAMACLTLPPKQRLWGMILGAGVAVLLRVIFTLLIAQAMEYPYLKLVGGALLGWIAGDVMVKDAVLADWLSAPVLELLHIWGGPVGGIIVVGAGYVLVGARRRLILDEILAGIALLIWIVVDRVSDSLFGGPDPDLVKIWSVRGGLLAVLIVVYAIARSLWHVEQK